VGNDINWDEIEEVELDTSPEAEIRFNAALKRGLRMPTTPEEDQLLDAWAKKQGW
jgi:hypothetical protein